jgi:hypothetical protein
MHGYSFSLDAQLHQIKEQAERNGVEIVKVFSDPAQSSYRKKYHPGINAMREAAVRASFAGLIGHPMAWRRPVANPLFFDRPVTKLIAVGDNE